MLIKINKLPQKKIVKDIVKVKYFFQEPSIYPMTNQQLQTNNNFGTGQINSEPCVLIPETPTQYTFSVNKITGIFFCNGQDLAKSQLLFPVRNLY